jgi:hypothetical protein
MVDKRGAAKVAATVNEKACIEQRINELNANLGRQENNETEEKIIKKEGRTALVEASKYLIFNEIDKRHEGAKTYSLSLQWLTKNKNANGNPDHIFYVCDESRFEDFRDQVRAKTEQIFTTTELEDLIERSVIRARGVSDRSWRNFLDGKEIYTSVFEAYCNFLNLEQDIIETLDKCPNYCSKSEYSNLFRFLNQFDHQAEVRHLQRIAQHPQRVGFFHIRNNDFCLYSSNWLMYRLERMILEYSEFQVRKIIYDFGSAIEEIEISGFYNRIINDLDGNVSKALNQNNIVLIFNNIDLLDNERLNQLINQVYQRIRNEILRNRRFLVIFAIDNGRSNNWSNTINDANNSIISIPFRERFSLQDIQSGIDELAARMQKEEINDTQFINTLYSNSNNGVPGLVLSQIYKTFNCQLSKEKRWLVYK